MLVEEHIRDAVDAGVEAVGTSGLLEFQEISHAAKRRDRRRRGLGGLATVLVACLAFISVGALLGAPDTTAVFAADPDAPSTPDYVIRSGDAYVGMSPVNAFETDDAGNVTIELVTSPDGIVWERVAGASSINRAGFQLIERDGVFHLVSTVRRVGEAEGAPSATGEQADRTPIVTFLSYATSTDLISWQEISFPMPEEIALEGHLLYLSDAEVVAGSAVAIVNQAPERFFEDDLEEQGFGYDSVCASTGTAASTTVRFCGQSESIEFPLDDVDWSFDVFLLRVTNDGLEHVSLPVIGGVVNSLGSEPTLYSTPDGVGIAGYKAFESTDGVDWETVETKRDVRTMMAVRGDERVYRSSFQVRRANERDIAVGMAYSSDNAETWIPTSVDDLFSEADTAPNWYSDLQVGEAGWAFVVQRNQLEPAADGVEITSPGGLADFTVTTPDGYELAGELPYGEARLLDPSGRLVREWDVLEPSNPVWSGFELIDGDVVLLGDDGRTIIAQFTGEQWRALYNGPGQGFHFDIVFSANGIDWTIIDSGTARPRILAIGDDEMVVQRQQVGLFSPWAPPLDVVELPEPGN